MGDASGHARRERRTELRAARVAFGAFLVLVAGCELVVGTEDRVLSSSDAGDASGDRTLTGDGPPDGFEASRDAAPDTAPGPPDAPASDAPVSFDAPPDAAPSVVLVGNQANPSSLVVVGSTVYWTDFGTGTVMACGVGGCGGNAQLLVNGGHGPGGLSTDGASLFWVDVGTPGAGYTDGDVMSCPLPTCSQSNVVTLATGQHNPTATTFDPKFGDLYWTNRGTSPSTGSVWKCKPASCSPSALGGGGSQDYPAGVAVDGVQGNRFWANSGSGVGVGSIEECASGGCGLPTVRAAAQASPLALVIAGSNLYWTNSVPQGQVKTASTSGGAAATIAQNQNNPSAIAVDPFYVYWADRGAGDGSGDVRRCALPPLGCGSSSLELAASQPQPVAVVVDSASNAVYWANFGTANTANGEIRKKTNPP